MRYIRVKIELDQRTHLVRADREFDNEAKSVCGRDPFPERWNTFKAGAASCPTCIHKAVVKRGKP
jgi:hypothetical protein